MKRLAVLVNTHAKNTRTCLFMPDFTIKRNILSISDLGLTLIWVPAYYLAYVRRFFKGSFRSLPF